MPMIDKNYADALKERMKKSRVYQRHQATGLALAELLDDKKHVALYMKLSKSHDEQTLMHIAKSVIEKKDVKNKGAYFMKIMKEKNLLKSGN
jgi:hypothetical protein